MRWPYEYKKKEFTFCKIWAPGAPLPQDPKLPQYQNSFTNNASISKLRLCHSTCIMGVEDC